MQPPSMPTGSRQPITIVIPMEDELIHTKMWPFCADRTCPCHKDETLIQEFLINPLNSGRLSWEGASLIFRGGPPQREHVDPPQLHVNLSVLIEMASQLDFILLVGNDDIFLQRGFSRWRWMSTSEALSITYWQALHRLLSLSH